ncbi:retropepsin-like aspartic protease family protein [Simplicispira suum]|jgi:aspartyl protease family protein|uniref:TIGR02281 family clan AA aspartic protease n=1 Tax=Simplicispira suum TaxID=2109915 RepID=A0A2S0N2L8_9BURK|nr:retropepsin-like aspartic protease [Simplicispira suum]AVO42287.1 TIGR02281 family clan AA aspartic protease [Simplicispira suum]MCB1978916.1 retroviral-like aspartic protease family protein [Burkholderiaceae bacterium]MCO5102923.1 retroviral-like aspartic protease family protein [Burkholderiaceae bacterium]
MARILNTLVFAACLALAGAPAAHAQDVALAGVLGSKALMVVGGGAPRAVAPGESYGGVKLISVSSEGAVVEASGQRHTLRLGTPVSVGASGKGRRVVLTPDSQGHFMREGQINGKGTTFMIDTGASVVAIGQVDAERMGLDFRKGQQVGVRTANGTAQGWRVKLNSVRLGDIELYGVDAVVTPQAMPFVLLGNSFLSDLHMTRNAQQMVLEKR